MDIRITAKRLLCLCLSLLLFAILAPVRASAASNRLDAPVAALSGTPAAALSGLHIPDLSNTPVSSLPGAMDAITILAGDEPISGGSGSNDFLPPEQRIYDYANLFTAEELKSLNHALGVASTSIDAHLIVLTTDDDVDMEEYAYQIYLANVNGAGGVYDCALLSINMTMRESYIDCYGDLRNLFVYEEVLEAWEILRGDLTAGNYAKVVNMFISDMSARITHKRAELYVDVPVVDPALRLYDFAGALSQEEKSDILTRIRDVSEKTGVAYILVTLDDWRDEAYLTRFAVEFYKRNFAGLPEFAGAYMLVVSCPEDDSDANYSWRMDCAIVPFGTFDPDNDFLWRDRDYVRSKLRYYTAYDACAYFMSRQLDSWLTANIALPGFYPEDHIHDYGNMLTAGQKDSLTALFEAKSRELDTWFYMVIAPYSTRGAALQFYLDFIRANKDRFPPNYVMLTVQCPPDVVGELPMVSVDYGGRRAINKLGTSARFDIRYAAESEILSNGNYAAVGEAFVRRASKALKSPVPKAEMSEMFVQIVTAGLIYAFILGALTVLILRISHGSGAKRKVSAQSYLVKSSVSLHYSSDRFVSSHTTSVLIETDSSSSIGGGGGSSFGSSGGGHSTRAGGSF